jgi:ornithine carbamoyltransferase
MVALIKTHCQRVTITSSPEEAVANADLVVTDVWASMGQEEEQKQRQSVFAKYQVSPALMNKARPEALFMHCLPAHRGEEISEDMLEHKTSVVWDEAENRLHAQKALLEFLLTEGTSD